MNFADVDAAAWPCQLTKKIHHEMYAAVDPSNPDLRVNGMTVLITGVSGVVGKAIAQAWATAGAEAIVISCRRMVILNTVADEIKAGRSDVKVLAIAADLRSEESVTKLWGEANAAFGKIDVLVNSAGTMNYAPSSDIEPGQWWNDFEVNVKGTYLMCHYFLRQSADAGTIITIGSGTSGSRFSNMSSSISSKLAQAKFMELMHTEHPGIRFHTLLPGWPKTEATGKDFLPFVRDDPMLSGGMSLLLCTRRTDWMRGGVMSVNWDLEEMEEHKVEIMRDGLHRLSFLNGRLGKGGHPWA